jgi:hypothetical protein
VRSEAFRLGRVRVAGCADLIILHARAGHINTQEAQSLLGRLAPEISVDLNKLTGAWGRRFPRLETRCAKGLSWPTSATWTSPTR